MDSQTFWILKQRRVRVISLIVTLKSGCWQLVDDSWSMYLSVRRQGPLGQPELSFIRCYGSHAANARSLSNSIKKRAWFVSAIRARPVGHRDLCHHASVAEPFGRFFLRLCSAWTLQADLWVAKDLDEFVQRVAEYNYSARQGVVQL